MSKTRWTARAESIRAVWASFDAIVSSLHMIIDESSDVKTKALADGLLSKILIIYEEYNVEDQDHD